MSVCGVPTLSWPYACAIDDNNSLKFDAGTGRLWVKPETPSYTYEATPTFTVIPGAAEIAPTASGDPLRVWWSGAVLEYGQNTSFDVSTVASITHTNATCYNQQIRAYAVMPEVRWMNAWHAMRCAIGLRGFYNGVQTGVTSSVSHDAELGAPWAVGPGGPFGDAYPELENLEGGTFPLLPSGPGTFNYKSASHLTDLWNGWTQILPGASATLTVRMIARTGPIPIADTPYYKSYTDILPNWMRLTAEVVTIG